MIVGIGIDTESVERVGRLLQAHGEWLGRIFTPGEQAVCEDAIAPQRMMRYAAAFAAKEAVMKALATGWGSDIEWSDIETPVLYSATARLSGKVARIAESKGIARITVSTAATRQSVVATAIAENAE